MNVISYKQAIDCIESDIAFDRDFTKLLADSMSCEFEDDEVINFWPYLLDKARKMDTKEGYNKGYHPNQTWLISLIHLLSAETAEFLAEECNPKRSCENSVFEPGDIVAPSEAASKTVKRECRREDEGGALYRGIWVSINTGYGPFIDLEEENQFKYFDKSIPKHLSKKHARLRKATQLFTKDGKKWQQNVFGNMFQEHFDGESRRYKIPEQYKNYTHWEQTLMPNEYKRFPTGLVLEKRFLPLSTKLKVSNEWVYRIQWTDDDNYPIQGWHAQSQENLARIDSSEDLLSENHRIPDYEERYMDFL